MFIIKTILLSLFLLVFVLPNSICIKSSRLLYSFLSPYFDSVKFTYYEKLELVQARFNFL